MNDKSNIKPFDPQGDDTAVAQNWDRWIRSFELFIEASAIQSSKRKKALLLHQAGENVQEIWFTLPEASQECEPSEDVYEICKKALSAMFMPKRNCPYERHLFRALTQKQSEPVGQFITRLKSQSKNCNFRNQEDEMIIDQLIEKCQSNELRRQLLKEGDSLTVSRAQELGRILETSEKQAGNIEAESRNRNSEQEVCRLKHTRQEQRNKGTKIRCYRCDAEDHIASDPKCPARDKKCTKCNKVGHYQKCCKTKGYKHNKLKKVCNLQDLKSAFHQIELDETSREITTFATSEGLYRFKRLFFGINCAPEIFQRIMEQITESLVGVEVYIDNFLVHGKTPEEHDRNMHCLLKKLEDAGLTVNPKKCKVARKTIEFMGHEITKEGIRPLQDRVQSIRNFRAPKSKRELQSFLGLIGFCSRFIPEYSALTEPLRRLLKKDLSFHWYREHQIAFDKLKNSLSESRTLGFFDANAKSVIIADASPYALGAVLTQHQREGRKVVEFASRALTDTEKKYSQTEKEALSLAWACERFHYYIYGTEFDLITDHKPLQFIFSPRSKPCPRVERWVMRLSGYNFKVTYQPGKQNIADPLSRLSVQPRQERSFDYGDEHVRWVAKQATPRSMDLEQIRQRYEEDAYLKELRNAIYEDKWPVKLRKYEIIKTELCVVDGVILRGTRLLIPASLRDNVLLLAHEGHPGIVQMKQRLRSKVWWIGLDKNVEAYCKQCHGCQLVGANEHPEPIKVTQLPDAPWKEVAMDFLGPLKDGTYLFVVIDYYSRFYEARFMKSITSSNTIEELEEMFARYGLPDVIVADNGRQFISQEFRDFCLNNGIHLRLNTPKWPQANGEVERQNRSIMKRLRIAHATEEDLSTSLREYMFAYHTTPHSTTGKTPAFLMFGRELRDKLPSFQKTGITPVQVEVRDLDKERKEKYKKYADAARNCNSRELNLGDQVLVKRDSITDKLQTPYHASPCKIIGKNGSSITFETPEGHKYTRNSTYVKKFNDPGDGNGKTEESEPLEEQHTSEKEDKPQLEVRRSCRPIRPPAWMSDYKG